jgi:Tfp pilus assembly protein PilX
VDKTSSKGIKAKKEEQGYILFVGILFMTCLLVLVVPFLLQLSTEYRLTNKYFQSSSALSLAEAGVERAIWEINNGNISGWNGDSSLRTMTISNFQAASGSVIGDIEIRISNTEGENPIIESTGLVSGSNSITFVRTARVVLERGSPPPSL